MVIIVFKTKFWLNTMEKRFNGILALFQGQSHVVDQAIKYIESLRVT